MEKRRSFIKKAVLGGGMLGTSLAIPGCNQATDQSSLATTAPEPTANKPLVISTWANQAANAAAWEILAEAGGAIDAVEAGAMVPEGDPNDQSVGYGGRPDREGRVTLDACIMDDQSNCGSVAFLQTIKHPIQVARLVMEKTPHVMLAGEGALQFALANGFEAEELLTPKSEKEWQEWLKTAEYKPEANIERHDTIGILALDADGRLAGACTTSGMAWKIHGRVGDSPIIGAGLFVDGEVGAATATGVGEAVIQIAGSHTVVELMRQGHSPQDACKLAVDRVIKKNLQQKYEDLQIGFLALDVHGNYGGYSVQEGFQMVVTKKEGVQLVDASFAG
ncbi:MAG: isoaspartyl peptidase/L-asparaginase family protein [Cyclobacteriaceae bacterium]